MLDFDVQRCTRRCYETEREFRAGETLYSVLVPEGADVVRRDYCEEAWQGPPEEAIGWWKCLMPESDGRKVNWAPNDVMLHYFQQLDGQDDKVDMRYVLALLMVRRRILKLEESQSDEAGRELLVLHCGRNDTEYKVLVADPTPERITEIQNELAVMLFGDAA